MGPPWGFSRGLTVRRYFRPPCQRYRIFFPRKSLHATDSLDLCECFFSQFWKIFFSPVKFCSSLTQKNFGHLPEKGKKQNKISVFRILEVLLFFPNQTPK